MCCTEITPVFSWFCCCCLLIVRSRYECDNAFELLFLLLGRSVCKQPAGSGRARSRAWRAASALRGALGVCVPSERRRLSSSCRRQTRRKGCARQHVRHHRFSRPPTVCVHTRRRLSPNPASRPRKRGGAHNALDTTGGVRHRVSGFCANRQNLAVATKQTRFFCLAYIQLVFRPRQQKNTLSWTDAAPAQFSSGPRSLQMLSFGPLPLKH